MTAQFPGHERGAAVIPGILPVIFPVMQESRVIAHLAHRHSPRSLLRLSYMHFARPYFSWRDLSCISRTCLTRTPRSTTPTTSYVTIIHRIPPPVAPSSTRPSRPRAKLSAPFYGHTIEARVLHICPFPSHGSERLVLPGILPVITAVKITVVNYPPGHNSASNAR